MSSSEEPSTTHAETIAEQNEKRWDRWSWLTLAAGLALILVPLLTSLAGMRYPGDGWASTSAGGFGITGSYRLTGNDSGQPSPLRPEDVVLAINGRPLTDDSLPPAPAGAQVGDMMRYTIQRAGDTPNEDVPVVLEVDVPVVRLAPVVVVQSWGRNFRENTGNAVFSLLLLILAVVVFFMRPGNLAARYLFLFVMFDRGITFSMYSGLFLGNYPAWMAFLWQTFGWGWVYVFMPSIALIVLVFPIRKWPVRRFPRLMPSMLMGLPFIVSVAANAATWFGGYLRPSELLLPLTIYTIGLMLAIVPTTLIHNLITIRDPLPRAQMRWIALGIGLGFLVPMVFLMLNFMVFGGGERWTRLGNLALIFFPISLGIGILRYRLFDIDIIIRRTTSYAIITTLLALIYFGSIVVLQRLLSPVTGESTPAVVISTLIIYALFQPIRRRVQDIIDRRFNRSRYNAEKTIETFAATVRNETDLDALTSELLRVIQQTMEPETLSIVLFDRVSDEPQLRYEALDSRKM
jgi:uncharacterized membrane protein (UPF0136 family)